MGIEDFDYWDFECKIERSVKMYDQNDELIQRLVLENLVNMSVDYVNKRFHAEHKDGSVYDIDFYKMVIV